MTLAPLFAAGPVITLHAFAAMALIPLTIAIFSLKRGSRLHKKLGWAWVTGMAVVAISSFWIAEIRLVGRFSPIHLVSIYTLFALFMAIRHIRRRRVADHRRVMLFLTWGALVGAGLFTLLPNRIMFAILTGS